MRQALHVRFWSKVEQRDGACWPWLSWRNARGYGKFMLNGRSQTAHRVAYELTHGPIPIGLCVMHSCDNPPCCNPQHLRLGTHAENMRDRDQKGRIGYRPRGTKNPRARLTDPEVLTIRARHANGESVRALSRTLGFGRNTIRNVVHRLTWTHI